MSLDSPFFISIFLPLLILSGALCRKKAIQNRIIFVSGLFFCAFSGIHGLCVLLTASALAFLLGKQLQKNRSKRLLWLGILLNLGNLGLYKYLSFFLSQILHISQPAFLALLTAPLGISFFTFKIISYLTDVYHDPENGAHSFRDLLLYVSFLPEVVSGPISRFPSFSENLTAPLASTKDLADGMRRFSIGLAKKLLLAYPLSKIVNPVFAMDAVLPCAAWLAAISYMLQLYYDFSGYSDMAIGLSQLMGYHSPENFRYPYLACSITDFWRRWHISLSGWFRDYVYIPLGGNRKGADRAAWNKMIVFLLCGLWHGAGWTFLIWGAWNGLFSALEARNRIPVSQMRTSPVEKILSHVYALAVVCIGFVIFRAADPVKAVKLLASMAGFHAENATPIVPLINRYTVFLLTAGILFCLPVGSWIELKRKESALMHALDSVLCILLLILSIIAMAAAGFQPFIYAQF